MIIKLWFLESGICKNPLPHSTYVGRMWEEGGVENPSYFSVWQKPLNRVVFYVNDIDIVVFICSHKIGSPVWADFIYVTPKRDDDIEWFFDHLYVNSSSVKASEKNNPTLLRGSSSCFASHNSTWSKSV